MGSIFIHTDIPHRIGRNICQNVFYRPRRGGFKVGGIL